MTDQFGMALWHLQTEQTADLADLTFVSLDWIWWLGRMFCSASHGDRFWVGIKLNIWVHCKMTIWVDINLGRDHRNLIIEGICSSICPDFHLCRITWQLSPLEMELPDVHYPFQSFQHPRLKKARSTRAPHSVSCEVLDFFEGPPLQTILKQRQMANWPTCCFLTPQDPWYIKETNPQLQWRSHAAFLTCDLFFCCGRMGINRLFRVQSSTYILYI